MTDRELFEKALEALEYAAERIGCPDDDDAIGVARKALRERLEQPEQEPVAWLVQYSNKHEFVWGQKPQWIADAIGIEPLYTTPPRREWVGLTEEEIRGLADKHLFYQPEGYEVSGVFALTRAVEAALREKNT